MLATRAPAAVTPALLLIALIMLAFNLRSTFTSLAPLLGTVEAQLGLSGAAAGALTALPVLCLAVFAPASDRFAARFGRERTALMAAILIALGHGFRSLGTSAPLLYAATFLAGLGVAAGGVAIPGIVKEAFPERAAIVTGVYLLAMTAGAGFGALLAVPLENVLGAWQLSLGAWALPAVAAALAWTWVVRRTHAPAPGDAREPGRLPWRSGAAWLLGGFLAAQASLAFAYIGWLPAAYAARGWTAGAAGSLLGVMIFGQLLTSLAVPALAARSIDRRPAIVVSAGATVAAAAWLWLLPGVAPHAATLLLGLGTGGGIAVTLVLLVDYGGGPSGATRLTAFTFLVAFSVGTIAPVLVGALRDATGGFGAPLAVLTLVAAAQALIGTRLGPRHRGSVR